jgi:hypothetical protein
VAVAAKVYVGVQLRELLKGPSNMRSTARLLFLAFSFALIASFGCSSKSQVPANWRAVLLPGGKAAIRVPPEYRSSTENEETLVLLPSNGSAITLRLNLHLPTESVASDIGVKFVRDQAKEKGLTVTEKKGKVYLTESGTAEEKGKKLLMQFWQIGFENAVVVMSATILDGKQESTEVKECLEKHVPLIIESLKKS